MYNLNQIPSEAQIRKILRRIVFGTNVFCPECRSRNVVRYQSRYRCRVCKSRYSLLSHTWLSNMKLPLQHFWLLLRCWTTQIPIKQTMSLTKLSEVSIRHWFSEFRDHLPNNKEILGHLVQLDEAYFKNTTLFMGKEIGTRKLAYEIYKGVSPAREHAWDFLQQNVEPETQLNTDGSSLYKKIDNWWSVKHEVNIHKKFEFDKTSEIEGMFGILRTFIRRMYHHVSSDKLPSLISEFSFRFSHPEMFENPQYYLEISLKLVTTR